MKHKLLIIFIIISSNLFAQETFSIVNAAGDTVFTIKENGDILKNGIPVGVPIGTIQAWDKNLDGTPELKDGWVECNGQLIEDTASPYNGKNVPDLNGENGMRRFLQGSDRTGEIGGDTSHNHIWISWDVYEDDHFGYNANGEEVKYKYSSNGEYSSTSGTASQQLPPLSDNRLDKTRPRDYHYTNNASTLPPYYCIVWVIKIK